MNAPSYKPDRSPKKFSVGDLVGLMTSRGEIVGKISSISMGGTHTVVADGVEYRKSADELMTISAASAPTVDSVAAHLQAGGQAFYTPSRERYSADPGMLNFEDKSQPHEPIPLHSVWMGKKSNLSDLVNFGDVASGSAKIDMGQGASTSKVQREPIDRMHDRELKYFIQKEAHEHDKDGFDTFPESDKTAKYGKHSLNEMLANQDLATDENVKEWIAHARKAAADRKAAAAQGSSNSGGGSGVLDAVQTTLDGVGVAGDAVVPGSGVAADGANVVISLLRAVTDEKNRGEHLKNAAISGVSMIPFVGDTAKIFKYGAKAARSGKIYSGGDDSEVSEAEAVSSAGEDPLTDRSESIKVKLFEFAGVVGKASAATVSASNSISLMNKAAIEYHRDLTKYNGAIAEAYGKLEAERAGRSVREGSQMSGSLAGLIESQSKLEERIQEFNTPWKIFGADVMRLLSELASLGMRVVDLLEPVSEVYVNYIRPLLEKMGLLKPGAAQVGSTGWMDRVRDQARESRKKPRKV